MGWNNRELGAKGLAHDKVTGEVEPAAYSAMLAALRSGSFDDFQALATNGHLGCKDPSKKKNKQRRFREPAVGLRV